MSAGGHRVFGVASIDAAGTIHLRVLLQHAVAPQPCAEVRYDRAHPGYVAVLEQIGPLAVGEEKVIHPEKIA